MELKNAERLVDDLKNLKFQLTLNLQQQNHNNFHNSKIISTKIPFTNPFSSPTNFKQWPINFGLHQQKSPNNCKRREKGSAFNLFFFGANPARKCVSMAGQ
jgi:hypothetical protein